MIIIFIIIYIVLALLLISYIVTIIKAKKDTIFAISYTRASWDNTNRYIILAIIILNVVSELMDITHHEDIIKLFVDVDDGGAWTVTHRTALIADSKAWIAAYLFLIYIWLATLLNNIGLFTKNGVYFLGSIKPKKFTAEADEKHIMIFIDGKEKPSFRFKRTEKNMERFKEYFIDE